MAFSRFIPIARNPASRSRMKYIWRLRIGDWCIALFPSRIAKIEMEIDVLEVRPSGRTTSVAQKMPLAPEASGAEAHESADSNVGAKAPTSERGQSSEQFSR